MKYILYIVLAFVISCNSSQQTVSNVEPMLAGSSSGNPTQYAESITQAELKDYLYTYASDEFEGRETGQPGQKKAVEYLKAAYQRLGISAAKKDGNYFQEVPLEIGQVPIGQVTVNGIAYELGESILAFSKAKGDFDNVIYAGYGIEEAAYSDYKDLDVAGKAILIKAGEPINEDGSYLLSGSDRKSIWSNPSESVGKRLELAANKGASAILYYDEENFARFKSRFEYMKNNDSGRMQLADQNQAGASNLFIDAKLAEAIVPNIARKATPEAMPVALALNIQSNNKSVASENVAAMIKGSEKPDEYLIISSHLDHIGITANGEINNGADDDGSGSVALLEIAEAFKKAADAGQGPKRSIIFLHVTGEEKGLLGSQYYTDIDPIVPLANTVADLNIDMIGRIDPKRKGDRNYIYLIGSDKLSTDLHELSETVNEKYTKIELDYTYNDENDPNRFYYRSDHYNFAKNNIPIIFYFNGTHDDYHKPGDTPDKINYDLLENRTRLVFYTAWEVANRAERVVVDKVVK